VLRSGGVLISGHLNPVYFLTDHDIRGRSLSVTYPLPFSDQTSLPRSRLRAKIKQSRPLEFGHTLSTLIGEQLKAGFVLTDFREDSWAGNRAELSRYTSLYILLHAMKP
jgi:hypothetical protein